ncbi:tumor necrosis factor receptor superfamily member 8 [Octodon degus]|uniref:Tumor necrosis factor receptor superfamily member 8 n=1 Tax=Octodon degus TaxID=10160 RepID=A0A6P6D6C1_OCTDE|nr:tumor necrosis factor receptor superfamily member 8 [Octodon degus]
MDQCPPQAEVTQMPIAMHVFLEKQPSEERRVKVAGSRTSEYLIAGTVLEQTGVRDGTTSMALPGGPSEHSSSPEFIEAMPRPDANLGSALTRKPEDRGSVPTKTVLAVLGLHGVGLSPASMTVGPLLSSTGPLLTLPRVLEEARPGHTAGGFTRCLEERAATSGPVPGSGSGQRRSSKQSGEGGLRLNLEKRPHFGSDFTTRGPLPAAGEAREGSCRRPGSEHPDGATRARLHPARDARPPSCLGTVAPGDAPSLPAAFPGGKLTEAREAPKPRLLTWIHSAHVRGTEGKRKRRGPFIPSAGSVSAKPCPQGPSDCRKKQCLPEHYIDESGYCTACVSCRDDLVEKAPCSWNSSRVCECRPGMVCAISATNSCARCVTRPTCAPGTVPGLQDCVPGDPTFEAPPLETHPDCSPPVGSEAPASTDPTLSPLVGSPTNHRLPVSTSAPVSLSSTGKPILDPGPVVFWVIVVLAVVLGSGSFLLCYRRACRARIGQKLHLCYPTQTFRPKVEPADSRPRRNLLRARSDVLGTEADTGVLSVTSPQLVETCASVGAACPESVLLLGASPAGDEAASRDPPESRVSTEHTNNRIEKIYIMKADTVIVGSVKTEVPEGRVAGLAGPELEAELEVDQAPRYPEQETEPPLGNCGDLMFSVEEEGKEDPWPSGK